MPRERTPKSGRKAPRPPQVGPASPRVRRRQKTARTVVKKDTTLFAHEPSPREMPGVIARKPGRR
jgi:hypothetical protein